MTITSTSNSVGFTLIEVLVAVVVMMVGLLGLLQSINVSIAHDIKNKLRNEAVSVGEEQLNKFKFFSTSLPEGTYSGDTTRTIRGIPKNFHVKKEWQRISSDDTVRKLTVTVSWSDKNLSSSHSISSVLRNDK